MTEPLVSIIVPIYNVEKYLPKCLDSLISQTYKNLEIILVDDGSPDNCGAICDEYAAKDSRIKVIHKPNGGLSSARNAGLRVTTGDWVAFVDSDDWVEPDYIGYLLENALKNDAVIAVCGHFEEYDDNAAERSPGDMTLDAEAAMKLLLEDKTVRNYVWDKLWKAGLFHDIEFPAGKNYEDLAVTWKLFKEASRIICLPEAKYHFFARQGSIVHDDSLQNRLNWFLAMQERCEEMWELYPQFRGLLENSFLWPAAVIWTTYYENPRSERERLRPELHHIARFMREYHPGKEIVSTLGPTGRIVAAMLQYDTWWAFAISALCGKIYELKHGRRR